MSYITSCPACKNNSSFRYLNYDNNPKEDQWSYNCFSDKELAHCQTCSFFFTRNEFKEHELNEFYHELYKDKELKKYNPSSRYEFVPRNFSHVNFVKNSIALKDNMHILEVGPNQYGMIASFNFYCKPHYYYFEQFDFPIIKSYGGKRVGDYFNKENVKRSNLKNLDLIVLGHSLEHFAPKTLRENLSLFHNLLRKNGHLSIEVPLGTKLEKMPPHTLFFNVNNLSILLKDMNFEIVSTQTVDTDEDPQTRNSTKVSNQQYKRKKLSIFAILKQGILSIAMHAKPLRSLIIMILSTKYHRKLIPLYDGRPYIRVLAKKR